MIKHSIEENCAGITISRNFKSNRATSFKDYIFQVCEVEVVCA